MDHLKLWLHLLSTPELGRKKIRKLLNLFGKPTAFIGNQQSNINDLTFINEQQKKHLIEYREPENWKQVDTIIRKFNIKFIDIQSSEYPPYLASIFDPPVMIFYRGNINCLSNRQAIAIVGTRRPSAYGKLMTRKIGSELSKAGFSIVSGLAYGVDSVAHNTALEQGYPTAAVMATGPDMIYPPGNKNLAERIITNGVILSEYLPGSKAEKWCFPTRNRIISGLSKGSLIIEGSRKSGALLTAKFALDQNRDVFALPGDVTRPQSEGPNYLIKIGAKPVCSASDILEEYDVLINKQERTLNNLSDEENKILKLIISNKSEISFDKIMIKSRLQVNSLSALLLSMELKSVIKKIEGNKFIAL